MKRTGTSAGELVGHWQVRPHHGVGPLVFGMREREIAELVGPPARRARDDFGTRVLVFRIGLECHFDPDDGGRVGQFDLTSEHFRLAGRHLVGLTVDQLNQRASEDLRGLEKDDEYPYLDASDYTCDRLGLYFWLRAGRVETVTVRPRYNATGERILWPTHTP